MKLIIPNVLDNKRYEGEPITEKDIVVGVYTARRWLWLMEPHDIIILPDQPSQDIIDYIAEIKGINSKELTIVSLKEGPKLVVSEALRNPSLISHLKQLIKKPHSWEIDPFYYTPAVLDLAEEIGIPVDPKWNVLVRQNFCHRVNGKAYFRQLSTVHDIPIPEGDVCASEMQLAASIKKFLPITGQVLVKQDFSAGGAGNVGISKDPHALFTGTTNQVTLGDLKKVAHEIWTKYTSLANNQLILEVYYPNKGVYTCDTYIPLRKKEVKMVNYAEMRMDPHWIGGEIPTDGMEGKVLKELISLTLKVGKLLQNEGYYGYMCSDVIVSNDNRLLFTELNVRQSGFLHADILARNLFGEDYLDKVYLLIRKDIEIGSFEKAHKILDKAGLLFKRNKRDAGVVMLTMYDTRAEFMAIASDSAKAHDLESSLLQLFP